MKNFNFSLFFGSFIISIGIVITGWLISSNLPDTTFIPSDFGIYMTDGNTSAYRSSDFQEYAYDLDVAVLLMMSTDEFSDYITTGALDGTFAIINGRRIFSREKIIEWLNDRIETK